MSVFMADLVTDFCLEHIFDCGQCFRWNRQEDGIYLGIAGGRPARISFSENNVLVEDGIRESNPDFWRKYLDLDRDYGRIKDHLAQRDAVLDKAMAFGYGIRILQQDLWETIVSFIISQNNHIPRIKGCIERLAASFGEEVGTFYDRRWYNLPAPEILSVLTEEDLAPIKLGYRAKYLIQTAKQVCQRGLPENREELLRLCGVGPKVANCIALFGLGDYASFPVDVWVGRVMNRLYGMEEKNRQQIEAYAQKTYGELGGFAQQYLFYYIRENH